MQRNLENVVYRTMENQVSLFINDAAKTIESVEKKFARYISIYDKAVADLSKKISIEEHEGSRIYGKYVTGEIMKEELVIKQKKSEKHLVDLKKKLEEQENCKTKKEKASKQDLKWLKAFLQCKSKVDLKRDLLECLINRIYLYPGLNLKIEFNFRDEFKTQLEEKAGKKA